VLTYDTTGTLTEHFQTGYTNGEPYDGSAYTMRFDERLQASVWEHAGSGIRVWSEALDLRASAPQHPWIVLYHYVGCDEFVDIVSKRKKPVDALTTLASKAHHFGIGMLTNSKEPHAFGCKEDVLLNNKWPRIGDAFKTGPGQVKSLLGSGNPEGGPTDPANRWVCEEVLEDTRTIGDVDCCVPILVPSCFAYDIWTRMTPELEGVIPVGCNKWGEKQWQGRDICIVQVSQKGHASLSEAGFEGLVDILCRRIAHLEKTKGRAHDESLRSVCDLAVLLQAMGRHQEAKPLLRRVLEGRGSKSGESCCDTQNFHRHLGKVLHGISKPEEVRLRLRNVMLGCERIFGPGHPYTFAAVADLAMFMQSVGEREEAALLLQGVLEREEEAALGPGSGSPEAVLGATGSLVALLQSLGRHAEAERLQRRVLARGRQALGPTHAAVLQAAYDLAMLQKAGGDRKLAEQTLRQALLACEAELGRGHVRTRQSLMELAEFLRGVGRQDEAESLLEGGAEAGGSEAVV